MLPIYAQRGYVSLHCQQYKYIVQCAAVPLQLNCVSPLSYDTERKETENSLNSHLYWFILYCLRFMNYCKSDGVSHNTATGFLNQADRLIIELRQWRQRSMEECTIPDPGGENITQHSLVVRSCCTRTTPPNNCHGTLYQSRQWNRIGLTIMESRATRIVDQSHAAPLILHDFSNTLINITVLSSFTVCCTYVGRVMIIYTDSSNA